MLVTLISRSAAPSINPSACTYLSCSSLAPGRLGVEKKAAHPIFSRGMKREESRGWKMLLEELSGDNVPVLEQVFVRRVVRIYSSARIVWKCSGNLIDKYSSQILSGRNRRVFFCGRFGELISFWPCFVRRRVSFLLLTSCSKFCKFLKYFRRLSSQKIYSLHFLFSSK